MKYLIVLEGNRQCAAYDSKEVAEAEAQRLSTRAGAHFIAVAQREDHTSALLSALRDAVMWADKMDTGDPIDGDPIAAWRAAIAAAEGRE